MAKNTWGTGSVRQRPGKRPEVRVWIDGERRSFTGSTVAEARQRANEARRVQRVADKDGPTIRDWIIAWLERQRSSMAPQGWLAYEQYARRHIVPHLGHLRLTSLTPDDIEQWHDALARTLGPTTVHHVHTTLQAALGAAAKRGLPVSTAISAVARPRRQQNEIETLTRTEAKRVLAAARNDPFEAAFVLAITVGMRSGELRALSWRDIDFDRKSIRVRANASRGFDTGYVIKRPKTSAGSRTICPVPEIALDALRRAPHRGELVFPGLDDRPIAAATWYSRWVALRDRASVSKVSFHALRHTAATHALEDGVPPHVVAHMLGHASVATTLRLYAHVTRLSADVAAQAIDARYGTAKPSQ